MKRIINFLKEAPTYFPTFICDKINENDRYSIYVRRRITKDKFNVIRVKYKNGNTENTFSELIAEANSFEQAVRIAKKNCEDHNDAL